jgi:hypothetical protein
MGILIWPHWPRPLPTLDPPPLVPVPSKHPDEAAVPASEEREPFSPQLRMLYLRRDQRGSCQWTSPSGSVHF